MDSVQRLLSMAERARHQRQPAPASLSGQRPAPPSAEDAAWRHGRAQQALMDAVRAGRELDRAAREELAWFARLGLTETQALDYLLRKYPPTPP